MHVRSASMHGNNDVFMIELDLFFEPEGMFRCNGESICKNPESPIFKSNSTIPTLWSIEF